MALSLCSQNRIMLTFQNLFLIVAKSGKKWVKVGAHRRGGALRRGGGVPRGHPSRAGQQGPLGDSRPAPRRAHASGRRKAGADGGPEPLPPALSLAELGADPAAPDGAVELQRENP